MDIIFLLPQMELYLFLMLFLYNEHILTDMENHIMISSLINHLFPWTFILFKLGYIWYHNK